MKYRMRREAYISGEADSMSGDRYPREKYGFPEAVLGLVKEFFESDECGTPDTWGRKIFFKNKGKKVPRVLVHLKAPNREKNWLLFNRLYGEKCIQRCKESNQQTGRKLKPRVPSERLLDSLRPNNWVRPS